MRLPSTADCGPRAVTHSDAEGPPMAGSRKVAQLRFTSNATEPREENHVRLQLQSKQGIEQRRPRAELRGGGIRFQHVAGQFRRCPRSAGGRRCDGHPGLCHGNVQPQHAPAVLQGAGHRHEVHHDPAEHSSAGGLGEGVPHDLRHHSMRRQGDCFRVRSAARTPAGTWRPVRPPHQSPGPSATWHSRRSRARASSRRSSRASSSVRPDSSTKDFQSAR